MKIDIGGGNVLSVLLGVMFIGLKLGHVISWPWVWVLAPFWVPISILATIIVFFWFVVKTIEIFERK